MPIDIGRGTITLDKTNYIYDGKAKKPNPTVIVGEKLLQKNKDYTVRYENNVNVGIATATITGIGHYTGEQKLEFVIVKKATDLIDLKNTEISILDFSENMEVEYNKREHMFDIYIKDGQKNLRKRNRLYS